MDQTTATRTNEGQLASADAAGARDLMVAGLRNAHAMERQAIEMLERNVDRLEHYPQLKARIEQHLKESREQEAAIAGALEALGESRSALKDTALGLVGNLQAMAHSMADDEVLKNSFAAYAFEHFEIASYRALAIVARAAGEHQVEHLAQRIEREEMAMASWLEAHLPEVVSRYVELLGTGNEKR